MRMKNTNPVQKLPKLPETRPERILSEAPPWREVFTTSFTWVELGEVKILVNSGISAAPSVPQLMMAESPIQYPSPKSPKMSQLAIKVQMIERMEVAQTSEVSGCSKSMSSALLYLALDSALLR